MFETLPPQTAYAAIIVVYAAYHKIRHGVQKESDRGAFMNNVNTFRMLFVLFLIWFFVLLPAQYHFSSWAGTKNPAISLLYVLLPLPFVVGIWEFTKTIFTFLIASVVYFVYLFWFVLF